MLQLAGGVTAVQLRPMALDEDAVAVKPVGALGSPFAPTSLGESNAITRHAGAEDLLA
jgi:hypothetical protein